MQSYMQRQTGKSFDWYRELEALRTIKTGGLIHQRLGGYRERQGKAISLASQWTTCACGNMCDIIPRTEDGRPVDTTLTHLGIIFPRAIEAGNYDGALSILDQIEERSAVLIKHELKDRSRNENS
jgi:hypothetical protein